MRRGNTNVCINIKRTENELTSFISKRSDAKEVDQVCSCRLMLLV